MRPLRYSINLTLDGCCDHREMTPDAATHRHAEEFIAAGDGLLLGRVTYQMMEEGWRAVAETGVRPDWMAEWMVPFAHTIHATRKYVVSRSLNHVDWNAELVRGDLRARVEELKQQPGRPLLTGGGTLPMALAEMGLIDEYEFVVHPRLVGHGRRLFEGMPVPVELELVGVERVGDRAVALRYRKR
jgi:dihydrofolate reductase